MVTLAGVGSWWQLILIRIIDLNDGKTLVRTGPLRARKEGVIAIIWLIRKLVWRLVCLWNTEK